MNELPWSDLIHFWRLKNHSLFFTRWAEFKISFAIIMRHEWWTVEWILTFERTWIKYTHNLRLLQLFVYHYCDKIYEILFLYHGMRENSLANWCLYWMPLEEVLDEDATGHQWSIEMTDFHHNPAYFLHIDRT